jgi:hypothetical protein
MEAMTRYLLGRLRRPGPWVLVALTLLAAIAAYQVRHAHDIDVGSPGDDPYVRNFHDRVADTQQGRTFRWSDAYSYLAVPGLGGGVPYSLTLTLNPGRVAVPLTVLVNGEPFLQTQLSPGWQTLSLAVDAHHPAALASRDLVVELRVPPTGIMVDRLVVGPMGPGFIAPAYLQLLYLAAIVLLIYLLLARLLYMMRSLQAHTVTEITRTNLRAPRLPVTSINAERLALGGTGLAALVLIGLLAWLHLPVTAGSGPLTAALLGAHLLLALAERVHGWLAGEARVLVQLLACPLLWIIVALTLVAAIPAYQVRHAYDIDVGSPGDQAYMRNFRDREFDDATGGLFRRGGTDSYVVLPGVGGGTAYSVTVTLNPGHPNFQATINLNGETYLAQVLPNGWQSYTFSVDAAHPRALAAPDLVLEFRPIPTTELLLDRVQVSTGGAGFVAPGLDQLAGLAAIVLLVYLLIGRAMIGLSRLQWVPLAGAAGAGALLVSLLAAFHLGLTVATAHLVTTGVLGYVLLVLAEPLARRLVPPAPAWAARVAAVLVAAAFIARFGAMALPQTVVLDMVYHMKWMNETLAGNWAALTDPHGGLNRPPRRWDLGLYIPKSPLFYIVAAPLALVPGELQIVIEAFICLLEASIVLFCYVLLARFAPALGGWRAGLWAGFAYTANPLGFRALTYGILPTLLAQWLTVAFFTLLLVWAQGVIGQRSATTDARIPVHLQDTTQAAQTPASGHPKSRVQHIAVLALLLVLLTAALVAFPTVAVFDSMVLVGLALVWLGRRYRRVGWAVGGLLAGAWAAALLIYYGLYVPDMLNTTLPLLLNPAPSAGTGGAAPAASTVHWSGPLDLLAWTYTNLVSAVPLLTGLAGLVLLAAVAWRRSGQPPGSAPRPERLLAPLALFWTAILPLFLVVNYRVDMIGKHLFFTMMPLALGSGIFFWLLSRQRRLAHVTVSLIAGALVWVALVFWLGALTPATL